MSDKKKQYAVTLLQSKTFEVASENEIDEQIKTELASEGWELVDITVEIQL